MTPPSSDTERDETRGEAAGELDEQVGDGDTIADGADGEGIADDVVDEKAPPSDTGPVRRERLAERASDKASRVTERRLEQAREMAAQLRHKRDCPEEGAMPDDGERRVEFFPSIKPRTEDDPAQKMLVVRCIECGEAEVAVDESEAS